MGTGMTGELCRAWVGAWVVRGIGAWVVHGIGACVGDVSCCGVGVG